MSGFLATPSLIIGLGGAGLKVASFVKKSLLEANQNELPAGMAILVLDTEREIKFQAGGWGQERSRYHATGSVRIDVGEYVGLTGNVLDKGRQIRNEQLAIASNPSVQRSQPNQHINNWFQARYYLDQAGVDDAVWNLDVGAGQFRQFGRLALFNNIDRVITKLRSALQAIRQMSPAATVYVHVTGSLAGGTGASLFVDIPHLVREIAKDVGFTQSPVILGHFVLGEAFRGTPQIRLSESGVKQQFDARTYAALRELTRLQSTVTQNVGGYPLVYDPYGVREKRAKLEKNPYSAVYLYDGQRANNPLNIFPLEHGLAPAIADAIVAYVDDKSGGAFCSHSVNYQAFYSAYNIPTGQVTYGSVGTYTIELPIYHITEGWAHDLARQTLDVLLTPASFDKDNSTPTALMSDQPGGKPAEPEENARRWLRENTTALVSQLAEWGQVAGRTSSQRQQVVDAVLAMDAVTWQQKLAPSDPRFQNFVNEAQSELQANLGDKESHKYYVNHNAPGDSAEQRADNLQLDIESKVRQMVGGMTDNWKREGGDFRGVMAFLGSHHVRSFEDILVSWVSSNLNGSNVGIAIEKKQGKLGYVETMLRHVQKTLADSVAVLQQAEEDTKWKRIPVYQAMDEEVKNLTVTIRRNSGLFNRNLKVYRDKWNEIAQFHKTDIARQIIQDLAVRLHQAVNKLVDEIALWKRVLGIAPLIHGGAYALVVKGQDEVAVDRDKANNAVNWVIANDEPGDSYIQEKLTNYAEGQLERILDSIEWKVGREDGNRGLQVDFTLGGQNWDRRAGQPEQIVLGQRNVSELLNRCRQPFEVAWSDMSVAAYLHRNYDHRLEELAYLIYQKSGYLLATSAQQPTMRTTFVRVFKEGLTVQQEQFLISLRSEVSKLFDETTWGQQRAAAVEGGKDYLNEAGQDSRDRFKITFVLFGDLLTPDLIAGYKGSQSNYHTTSSSWGKSLELHILPAETNALEIERELSVGDHPQMRRELMDEIVAILEDRQRFHLAMRCLAYGETDYLWGVGDESGLLLHRYPPLRNNPTGHDYWRLTVEPEGRRGDDGRVYDTTGRLAKPLHYQLTDMSRMPDLVSAFMQLCCRGADKQDGRPIDWERLEETLASVMQKHKQQWSGELDQHWRFNPSQPRQFRDEAYDKAAQVIQLSALIEESNIKLDEHQWAWHPQWPPMPSKLANNRASQQNVQRFVDLHSALQQAAHEEMHNLGARLGQLGTWLRNIPSSRTSFVQSEAVEDEVGDWSGDEAVTDLPIETQLWESIKLQLPSVVSGIGDWIEAPCRIEVDKLFRAGVSGEVIFTIEAPNFHLANNINASSFLIAADVKGKREWNLRLCPTRAGQQTITLHPYVNGTKYPEKSFTIVVGRRSKPRQRIALESPIPRSLPHADLALRIYTSQESTDDLTTLEYVAYSSQARFNLLGQHVGEVKFALADMQRLRWRLSQILADSGEVHALAAYGNELYNQLFPEQFKAIYQQLHRQIDSILILTDSEPWIPWELVKPPGSFGFWADKHRLGRWIEGLGTLRQSEIPLGQVAIAVDTASRPYITAAAFTALVNPGDFRRLNTPLFVDWPGDFLNAFVYDSPIWGLHLETTTAEAREGMALSTLVTDQSTPERVRNRAVNLRRKQPLVTLASTRYENEMPTLSEAETRWLPTFIKNGAAAFVASLWTTKPETGQLFWTTLYEQLWARKSLGVAVQQARQALIKAYPDSPDWLAYYLVGDPMAKGYVPPESGNYVTVECLSHDLSQPLHLGQPYTFIATMRTTPPDWDTGRRKQLVSNTWTDPHIYIRATGTELKPKDELPLQALGNGLYVAQFDLVPHQEGQQEVFVRFLSGSKTKQTISFMITVAG